MATVSAGMGTEAGLSGKGTRLRSSALPYCFPDFPNVSAHLYNLAEAITGTDLYSLKM